MPFHWRVDCVQLEFPYYLAKLYELFSRVKHIKTRELTQHLSKADSRNELSIKNDEVPNSQYEITKLSNLYSWTVVRQS